MRFKITSHVGDVNHNLFTVMSTLQEWLNAALSDGDFGDGIEQFTFIIVSVVDDISENEKWAKTHNRLGRYKDHFTSELVRYISISVELSPSSIASTELNNLYYLVSNAITNRLLSRPKRLPKNFDFTRCANAITATLAVYSKNPT